MDIEVLHISEVAAAGLKKGKLRFRALPEQRVTYHDACMLGRLSEKYVPWEGVIKPYGVHEPPKVWRRGATGCYEPPREVLAAIPGIRLTEMVRNKEDAYCCGAGGGAGDAAPAFATWAADERLREARAAEAQTIVSACPFCGDKFEKARGSAETPGPKHIDFVHLVAEALL
jgi:Fe-S oxidoreductase